MPSVGGLELAIIALIAVGVLSVFLVFIVGLARLLFGSRRRPDADVGVHVLDGRLARGEITREEYAIARRALGR